MFKLSKELFTLLIISTILGCKSTPQISRYYLVESVASKSKLNSEQKIVSSLLQELDQMFDGKATASYSGDYVLENWGQHEFTQGTWTQPFQEKKSQLKVLNLPLDNKVYFAGEIYDTYQQMGVPGAILSGYYAIDKLLLN